VDLYSWSTKAGIFSIWHDYQKKELPEDMEIKPDKVISKNTRNTSTILRED